MKQVQKIPFPLSSIGGRRTPLTSLRLLISLLIGVGITAVFSLIIIFGVLIPFHMLIQWPFLLILIGLALLIFTGLSVWSMKPVAVTRYLRTVHNAQEKYHALYTPLTALTNIRHTTGLARAPMAEPASANDTIDTEQRNEYTSILQLVEHQNTHLLILGVPGAGKTMALRVYQYLASQKALKLALMGGKIPVYVPMKNYSLFLKQRQFGLWQLSSGSDIAAAPASSDSTPSLLTYLMQGDLPGIRHLRPYLPALFAQGRLLLLCDGLNEIDSSYLSQVSTELVDVMRSSQNRLVMTCREVDYREQSKFIQLVEDGQAARVVIYPLQPEQVAEFVNRYVDKQNGQWQHTAEQIMTVIDRSRLRYHCTNPMMLFTLMEIIDTIGVERGKQIDTRGRLLRESVSQLLQREIEKWGGGAPSEQEVVRFLSEVACAARWAQDRNAIQLSVPAVSTVSAAHGMRNFDEVRDDLKDWLDEHPAQGPFVEASEPLSDGYDDIAVLLQFAQDAGVIEISTDHVLSFRHELIAEYLVAEYFAMCAPRFLSSLAIREELLEDVGRWSEPVAIWAGLLDDPLELAERFGLLGLSNQAYVLQALTLGLICVGVLWTPPQAEVQYRVDLPPSIEEALSIAVRNKAAREELAQIFTHCAEEGGQEVYRSLFPLITADGVDELLTLLDRSVVPDLLFTQLRDAVDDMAYEQQVKRIVRVLGRFGETVVERAEQLSLPAPERSLRLRAAAVNTLGWTNDSHAVEPLIGRLRDSELFIAQRATNALIRLGPQLILSRSLEELEDRTASPFLSRVHQAILTMVDRFLDEQDTSKYQITAMQYQHILEHVVPILTSHYQSEPETQQVAREFLIKQGRNVSSTTSRERRWEKVIDALLGYLSGQNEVATQNAVMALQEIGVPAVPRLIERLNNPSEVVRVRVVQILSEERDFRALNPLLKLLGDAQPVVRQHVVHALQVYVPESIPGLIDLILAGPDDIVAERAATVLESIGVAVIEPILGALPSDISERTRFLVQVLERLHDPRALPALIDLLAQPELEQLLILAIIRALGQFADLRVVTPLLQVLAINNTMIDEAAIFALSRLGLLAFAGLVEALNTDVETPVTQRVRRALSMMDPFPGEQLIAMLEQRQSEAQAEQVLRVLCDKGREAAQVLVNNLLHRDEAVREYIYQALKRMSGNEVVPALLNALYQPALRAVISSLLLQYPEVALPPLIALLGEHERSLIALDLLPRFGLAVLRPLITGLNDQRTTARELAQQVIVALVRQQPVSEQQQILLAVVHLFHPTPPPYAREALLDLLTEELSAVSLPALLDGLEDARLVEDVSEAFVRLARVAALQEVVLDQLIDALFIDERRQGAEIALIRNGGLVVARVGDLIVNKNVSVAKSAQFILCEIGVPALSFIWTAQSDRSNLSRREAAMTIFRSMPPEVIKDELVALLVSDDRDDIAMAVSLLLERIHQEAKLAYEEHVMLPELIEFVQTNAGQETNLRIMALLLLMGEQAIIDHMVQALSDDPQQRKQLIYLFLLLGPKTQKLLLEVFEDEDSPMALRAEIATILSLTQAPAAVTAYVDNIGKYGIANRRPGSPYPEQLSVSLRTLGGLLASGKWDVRKLQDLRESDVNDEALYELSNVLLGWRYEPQLKQLQQDLERQRDTFKKEALLSVGKMAQQQERISALEENIAELREEQGETDDHIKKVQQEKEELRVNLDKIIRERNRLRQDVQQKEKEKKDLADLLRQQQTPKGQSGQSQPQHMR